MGWSRTQGNKGDGGDGVERSTTRTETLHNVLGLRPVRDMVGRISVRERERECVCLCGKK